MTPGENAGKIGLTSADEREAALYRRLAALSIAWITHAHMPVFTVEEARAARVEHLPGTHTKNLFLESKKGGLFLVVAREDLRLDLNALARALGVSRFSFGKTELLMEVLGIAPGAVSPFALMNDSNLRVRAIVDEGMLARDPLNFHPLRNDRTTAIVAADLLRFMRDTGHEPLVMKLPESARGE